MIIFDRLSLTSRLNINVAKMKNKNLKFIITLTKIISPIPVF